MTGKCYLVGAGPGDPGLITVKGRDCLRKADVLVYDALSSAEFLRWVPAQLRCTLSLSHVFAWFCCCFVRNSVIRKVVTILMLVREVTR